MAKVAMLGAGFIGDFYTYSLHGQEVVTKYMLFIHGMNSGKGFCKETWNTKMDHFHGGGCQ